MLELNSVPTAAVPVKVKLNEASPPDPTGSGGDDPTPPFGSSGIFTPASEPLTVPITCTRLSLALTVSAVVAVQVVSAGLALLPAQVITSAAPPEPVGSTNDPVVRICS